LERLASGYRSGELCRDWEAHRIIWESFYTPRGAELSVYVALEAGGPVGILPLLPRQHRLLPEDGSTAPQNGR
jgi:hypothetical protein